MQRRAEDQANRLGVECSAIRGNAAYGQAAQVQGSLEFLEEGGDVFLGRGVLQHLVLQPGEAMVIHNGEDAKRAIVHFVRRDVTGEVLEHSRQILRGQALSPFFFPPLRPSSEA